MDADTKSQLSALIACATSDKLVSSVQKILQVLNDKHLAWKQIILPHHVGAHPSNRDGLGLASSEVHSLLDDIMAVGFSPSEVRGICFEVESNDATIRDFNQRLAEASQGSLPQLEPGAIRFASVAGSHLNCTLNCWIQGIDHAGEPLSLAKLAESDPEYYRACKDGLCWTVISSAVSRHFPDLPLLIQSSQNVSSHLSRSESELQLLRKIWHAVVSAHNVGLTNVVWQDISKQVLRSKPTLGASAPMLFTFVMKFSGGVHGVWLEDTLSFAKAFGHAQRTVGAEIYEVLSADLRGSEQRAIYRHCNGVVISLHFLAPRNDSFFGFWFEF